MPAIGSTKRRNSASIGSAKRRRTGDDSRPVKTALQVEQEKVAMLRDIRETLRLMSEEPGSKRKK